MRQWNGAHTEQKKILGCKLREIWVFLYANEPPAWTHAKWAPWPTYRVGDRLRLTRLLVRIHATTNETTARHRRIEIGWG